MEAFAVETRGMSKKYGDYYAVRDLSLHVPQGKIYGLLGENGAGKTSAMKLLLGFTKPTEGDICLFGEKLDGTSQKMPQEVGALIESPGFYENLTAEENLSLLVRLRGVSDNSVVGKALERVGLSVSSGRRFGAFSVGMKQRLGIAAALLWHPRLLILDEPMNGLDPTGVREIRDCLLRASRDHGVTVLISSHLLGEMEQLTDVIGIMQGGRLLAETDMECLREKGIHLEEYFFELERGEGRDAESGVV